MDTSPAWATPTSFTLGVDHMPRPRRLNRSRAAIFAGTTVFGTLTACAGTPTAPPTADERTTTRTVEVRLENGERTIIVDGTEVDGIAPGDIVMMPDGTPDIEALMRTIASGTDGDEDRPMLGISMASSEGGVAIVAVMPGSPANAAGLRAGDVILAAGEGTDSREMMDAVDTDSLPALIATRRPGDAMTFAVRRGEGTMIKTVRLADWDPSVMGDAESDADDGDAPMEIGEMIRSLVGDRVGSERGAIMLEVDARDSRRAPGRGPGGHRLADRTSDRGRVRGADVSMDVEVFRDVDWRDHDEDDHRDHDDHDDHEHHHDWDGHREIDDVEDVFEMVGEMVEGFMHEAMGELQQRFHDFEREAQSWAEGMDERFHHIAEEADHRFEEIVRGTEERIDGMRREIEMHLRERDLERREAAMRFQERLAESGRQIEETFKRMDERNRMLEQRVQRLEMAIRRMQGGEPDRGDDANHGRRSASSSGSETTAIATIAVETDSARAGRRTTRAVANRRGPCPFVHARGEVG